MEGAIQVPQGFLGCALGDLEHPGELCLFKLVELAVELHCTRGFLGLLVFADFLGESPVVGEASGASVLAEVAALSVVGAELSPVGPVDNHVGGRYGGFEQRGFSLLER